MDVSKLDKSNEVNDEQFLNIQSIPLAREVLKLDKFKDVNDEHPLNILSIFLTLDVSKMINLMKLMMNIQKTFDQLRKHRMN